MNDLPDSSVSHGPGKALDNRRRTLRHASWNEISSNRGNPTSQYFGVAWSNSSGKWQVSMCIFEYRKTVFLGYYSEEAEAGAAADFVRENKAELRLRAAGMTKEDRNKYVRHCCSKKEIVDGTNHPLLYLYYIYFMMVSFLMNGTHRLESKLFPQQDGSRDHY